MNVSKLTFLNFLTLNSLSFIILTNTIVQEDSLIIELVKQHGLGKWSVIAAQLPGRIGKQCRERWGAGE